MTLTVEPMNTPFSFGAGIVGRPASTAPTGRSSCIAGM